MSRVQEVRLELDTSRCALCGGPNGCALAQDASVAAARDEAGAEPAASCWCVSEEFPASLLEVLPVEERGRRCVCRACLVAHVRKERRSE